VFLQCIIVDFDKNFNLILENFLRKIYKRRAQMNEKFLKSLERKTILDAKNMIQAKGWQFYSVDKGSDVSHLTEDKTIILFVEGYNVIEAKIARSV
jgi:hypothetical protein